MAAPICLHAAALSITFLNVRCSASKILYRKRYHHHGCRSAAAACLQDGRKLVQSSDLVERQFRELNLGQISEEVGGVRVRQHVNPLKASLMAPVMPPRWEEVFADPSLPLTVDIGCGSGRFLLMMARNNSRRTNFLGMDIRDKLVSRSLLWANALNLNNTFFMVTNATVTFDSIISSYPGKLNCVCIMCPDPHFKKRHHKRRIVQKPLVTAIIRHLHPDGKLFLQSDVLEVAKDMKEQFDAFVGTSLAHQHDNNCWISENPFGIPTEREIHALSQGGQMYRLLYKRILEQKHGEHTQEHTQRIEGYSVQTSGG